MELVRVPYLLDYKVEHASTTRRSARPRRSGKHVAPHVAWFTALWPS